MNKPVEIVLTAISYGGEAIGRYNGRAVFVPFALPGETVRVEIVEEHKNFLRAALVQVVKASPARIAPRCAHYGLCGGCHFQHLSYPSQLKTKTDILRDQFARIGKFQNPPVREMVASPSEWNYRNHVQFHLDPQGKPGFVTARGPEEVFAVRECHLPQAAINELWPGLDFEPGSPIERVSVRCGWQDDLMLVLESEDTGIPEMEVETDISVVHLSDEDATIIAGEDHLVISVLGRPFRVSAGSFFQVNTAMAEKMVSHLLEYLPVNSSSTLLDVYCGAGLFSAFFAPSVGRLIGIETAPSSCEDFAANLDEFENVDLYEAPAEEVLPELNLPVDAAIVDPPRAGLDKKALDALLRLAPARLAYVSCDPATLARDAARLVAGGYTLKHVTPFDLFPQTYHIESISLFER